MDEVLLDKKAVSKYLRVSESKINRWLRDGVLRHIKLGSSIRFRERDIQTFLDSRVRGAE